MLLGSWRFRFGIPHNSSKQFRFGRFVDASPLLIAPHALLLHVCSTAKGTPLRVCLCVQLPFLPRVQILSDSPKVEWLEICVAPVVVCTMHVHFTSFIQSGRVFGGIGNSGGCFWTGSFAQIFCVVCPMTVDGLFRSSCPRARTHCHDRLVLHSPRAPSATTPPRSRYSLVS
jgi:hypothetical protein